MNCRMKRAPAFAWCARPASAAAIARRRWRSVIISSTMPRLRTCSRRRRRATPTRTCPNISDTMPMWPAAATSCWRACAPAISRKRICSRRSTTRRCAGSEGRAFRRGERWPAVLADPGPRLMAINGDEGEPGTFKDRYYLETDPHRFIEGMLIGAHVVEAPEIYIYIRDEYPAARAILEREIARLPPGGPQLHLRRGAGAYICGEESSLLESIEGKRGLPRHKPPYPFQVGLFGQPTLIHNIETLWWGRELGEKGADWGKSHGRHDRHGLRSYSVSGRVKNPGMKLAPAGITVRELIDEFCGGMT